MRLQVGDKPETRRTSTGRVKHRENDLLAPGCYLLMYIKLVNFIDNNVHNALPLLAGEPVAGCASERGGVSPWHLG